jgi:carboxypeptidase Q
MKHILLPWVLLLAACGAGSGAGIPPQAPTALTPPTPEVVQAPEPEPVPAVQTQYAEVADKLATLAMADDEGWELLLELCDDIGPRLSGSDALNRAVDWAAARMEAAGHANVRKEPVMVPRWTRGAERLTLLAPRGADMPLLGLGGTVGTGKKGVTAEVIAVEDEKGLEALSKDDVRGKIVLFNNAMPPYTRDGGTHYGHTVRFRINGPRLAAEKGAVGVLVRSVTARSLRSPHTGTMGSYGEGAKIPAAAITTEDADLIWRWQQRGKTVKVKLELGAKYHGKVPSANVVGELRGHEKPDEIVVVSCHLDSWDVGTGAHDDGGGCIAAMHALTLLRKAGLTPRRTIRAVLYTNEENGLAGAKAYAEAHKLEVHVAAVESDSGVHNPQAFSVDHKDDGRRLSAVDRLGETVPLFATFRTEEAIKGFAGADVGQLKPRGTTLVGLRSDMAKYFDYHHSHADTVDKVDKDEFRRSVGAMALLAYLLADAEEPF